MAITGVSPILMVWVDLLDGVGLGQRLQLVVGNGLGNKERRCLGQINFQRLGDGFSLFVVKNPDQGTTQVSRIDLHDPSHFIRIQDDVLIIVAGLSLLRDSHAV